MFQHSKFNRLIAAGLAAAAIAPAAAVASPALDGGVAAPGSGVVQDMRAPDQVDGSTVDQPDRRPACRRGPVNPQPIPHQPRRDHQHSRG